MCLVKDQAKRPTAEKLLKHSFFKHAKPPELSVKKLFADLPPLWDRVKALEVIYLLRSIVFRSWFLFLGIYLDLSILCSIKMLLKLPLRECLQQNKRLYHGCEICLGISSLVAFLEPVKFS